MSGVELLVRNALEASPLFRSLAPEGVRLPDAPEPEWRGLSLEAPVVPPVTGRDLVARLHTLRRRIAERRVRVRGEPVAVGDDVQVRMLGYARGRLIPGAVRHDEWIALLPDDDLPGFAERLAGTRVGASAEIATTYRGERADYVVDVVAANALSLPADNAPELPSRLGRGETLDDLLTSLMADLQDERSEWARREVRERAVDELAVRVEAELPPDLVREEIRRRWAEREGRPLAWLGFNAGELREALEAWLEDGAVALEVGRSLRAYVAFSAIAREQRLQPDLGAWFDALAAITREPGDAVRTAVARDKKLAARLVEIATQSAALDLVMSHASIAAG